MGLILSYFAFLLKNNFAITQKLLIAGTVLIVVSGVGFLGLNNFAKNLTEQTNKNKAALCTKTSFNPFAINTIASVGHDEMSCNSTKMIATHDMSAMVTDDKTFLTGMIPHHIEAINTSKIIIQSTTDADLKGFATKVIEDQSKEVDSMKIWYKSLNDADYKDDGNYKPMMANMNSKMGSDLDKAYISGMIEHHEGAITMAKKILPISKLMDVKTLANNIVANQEQEVETLNAWLKNKFADSLPTVKNNETTTITPAPVMDNDGHMGH
jgi:uncharacterized protein (DUF305 family)